MNPLAPSQSDPRARPLPFTFFPPKSNPLVIALVKMSIQRTIRRKLQVSEIEISDDDLEQLRRLKNKRCLVTPSHSGGFEPHIIMYLSKLLGDDYNYVAAMELFQQSPIYRWLMPRLGVYSVDRIVFEEPTGSQYEQRLVTERQQAVRDHYDDLWRLLQFVAIYDGYVRESMTFERFLDVLCLLEMEVSRERRIWGPRKAIVKVGEPIDLKDHAGQYKANKRETVTHVTTTLESSVREMLESLESGCRLVDDVPAEN